MNFSQQSNPLMSTYGTGAPSAQQSNQTSQVTYKTLQTGKVIRYDELDKGFILRANEQVTYELRYFIRMGEFPPSMYPMRKNIDGEDDVEMEEEN